jgi:hypothetical protein
VEKLLFREEPGMFAVEVYAAVRQFVFILEREASPLAGFYAARISTTPTLQWMVLSPPYTGTRA